MPMLFSATAGCSSSRDTSSGTVAACTSDTITGLGFRVTISQPAPTSCIQVPMLETTVAIHNARNNGRLSGAQADADTTGPGAC